ncbi:peptidylprolyl isomerase [Salipaludibacillus sp. HK11]|uniref:peptidylprolyl isomerase n=1 Tax=Salipaludibacillus sp. HK11 TaxID=3394320 RepID=UPI0039FB9E8F
METVLEKIGVEKLRKSTIILMLFSLILLSACSNNSNVKDQSETNEFDHSYERIIVEADTWIITEDEFIEILKTEHGEQILQDIVHDKMIHAEAEKIGITEEEIQEEIQFLMTNIGAANEDVFYEMMEDQGISSDEDLRMRVINHLVIQHRIGLIGEVTEKELLKEYDRGEEVEARHILVEDEDTAFKVITLLEEGNNFEDLVDTYSRDPGTREVGGYLGSFRRGTMAPLLEEAAFTLEIGERSEPVQSQFGYHIVETTGRTLFEDEFEDVQELLFSTLNDRKLFKMNAEEINMLESLDISILDQDFEHLFK